VAGNKAAFDAAMKRAQGYAFENAWDKALREYQRALEEFPDDPEVRTNLGQAYFRLQQWAPALESYQALLRLRPGDPFVLGRIADCQMALNQRTEAETTYMQVAQVYLAGNQTREAMTALRNLINLNPANRQAHERLADIYKGMGERTFAINEYLTLSKLALETPPGDLDGAVRYAETAFTLDNNHAQAREWLYGLRRRQADAQGTQFDEKTLKVIASGGAAPLRDLDQMYQLAVQYQEKGQYAAALVQFQAAQQAGMDTPGLHYNLGLLYQQSRQWARAIEHFHRAENDPEFTMSVAYALGECYRESGQAIEATRAFEKAVGLVDLSGVSKNEVPDLVDLYRAAADANQATGDTARAASLYSSLAEFLQARRWRTGFTEELSSRAQQMAAQGLSNRLMSIGGGAMPDTDMGREEMGTSPLREVMPERGAPVPQAAIGLSVGGRSGMLRPITDFLREKQRTVSDDVPAPTPALPVDTPDVEATEPAAAPEPDVEPVVQRARVSAAPLPDLLPVATAGAPNMSPNMRTLLAQEGMPLDPEARDLVDAIDQLIANGLWAAAIDCSYEVIHLDPDYLPIHLRMAEVYRASGATEDALTKLQTVVDTYMVRGQPATASRVFPELIALQPDNVNMRTKLATLLLDLGQTDAAVGQYLDLAEMSYGSGQVDRALDELRRLRGLAPSNPDVRLRTGLYLLRADRPAEALPEFSRALQLDPENKPALVRVFITMSVLGNDTQWDALGTVLDAAARDPAARRLMSDELRQFALTADRPELFYALSLLNDVPAEEGDEEAHAAALRAQTDALDNGLALLPKDDQSALGLLMRFHRGHLALAAKDCRKAITLLQAAMEMLNSGTVQPLARADLPFLKLPSRLDIYQPLAQAYALNGDNAEAIAALQAAKAHAPYNRAIYTQLAELYFLQGQLGAALVALDELISHYQDSGQIEKVIETLGYMAKLAPNNITVRQKLADTYLKIGYIDLGLAELEVLAELQRKAGMVRESVKTYQRGADIYWQMGQMKEAFTIYDRVVRMAPGDVEARQQLIHLYITAGRLGDATREQKRIAEIYLQQKRSKDAIAALHELIALAPSDTESYYALAEVLAEQQEYGQAARLYGRLRRLEPAKDAQLAALQADMQQRADERNAGGGSPPPAER
jgi:tetratricopeptide (TPR) repeat protein